jgi:hypothetical protein
MCAVKQPLAQAETLLIKTIRQVCIGIKKGNYKTGAAGQD